MKLVNAKPDQVEGLEENSGKAHYLTSSDPRNWRTNITVA